MLGNIAITQYFTGWSLGVVLGRILKPIAPNVKGCLNPYFCSPFISVNSVNSVKFHHSVSWDIFWRTVSQSGLRHHGQLLPKD